MGRLTRCPRCEAAVIVNGSGALSRCTRDEGAEVIVCDRCGQRESLHSNVQIPMEDWPVEVEILLREEDALIRMFRGSEIAYIAADEIDGPA